MVDVSSVPQPIHGAGAGQCHAPVAVAAAGLALAVGRHVAQRLPEHHHTPIKVYETAHTPAPLHPHSAHHNARPAPHCGRAQSDLAVLRDAELLEVGLRSQRASKQQSRRCGGLLDAVSSELQSPSAGGKTYFDRATLKSRKSGYPPSHATPHRIVRHQLLKKMISK